MSLWSEYLTNQGSVIDKWTHYFPAYERHFGRYVDRPVVLLEIGCGEGGSLQLWKRYLGPYAQVIGVDIRPECSAFEDRQIAVRIGNQADTVFLDSVLAEFGAPDIVIDDGSHLMDHLTATFRHLYPRTDRNGVYLVEDLHTCYWHNFGGGLRREGSFMELCKTLLDELNAELSRDAIAPTDFTRNTLSMHFYDSMAVFERGRHMPKHSLPIGRQNE
jgi:SAM-dependent methyltransferase